MLLFTHSWRENNWIHTFPKGISAMWNVISLVQDLNSCHRVHFLHHRHLLIYMNQSADTYEREWAKRFRGKRHICSWWLFWPMGSKHSNPDERNVWNVRGTSEKYTSFGHTPWEYQWTFQLIFVSINPSVLICSDYSSLYLSLPPTRQDLTQGRWPEGRFLWGFRGGEGWAQAEARALLDYEA